MKNKLIVLSGLPGSGKTTLAEVISRHMMFPLFSLDVIKSTLLEMGLLKDFKDGSRAWRLTMSLVDQQLLLGNSVIVDAVNAEDEAKNTWYELARKYGVELKIIECFNSNERQHKERVASRVKNLHGIPEVTWEWVEDRRAVFTEWNVLTLRLDTSNTLLENAKKAMTYIGGAE